MAALDGKRVIVTGAAGGIGSAAIAACIAAGARVGCTFHDAKPTAAEDLIAERCEIADKASIDEAFDRLATALGGVDALIHAAGVHGSSVAAEVDIDTWERTFRLNVTATMLTNQAAFRHLSGRGGAIVNMGSVEGVRGYAGNACYAASRGAVMAWTRSVALEWGSCGIRVNALAPAAETGLAAAMRDRLDDAGRAAMDEYLRRTIPLGGRMGDPRDDIAPVLVFLVSDASRFITGQTIAADGGLMMLGS